MKKMDQILKISKIDKKIAGVNSLVKKTDYDTKISEN